MLPGAVLKANFCLNFVYPDNSRIAQYSSFVTHNFPGTVNPSAMFAMGYGVCSGAVVMF